MIVAGRLLFRLLQSGEDGDQLVIFEKFYGMFGSLQPEFLFDQTERGRVKGLFELDMTVAMEFDFCPDCRFRRSVCPGAASAGAVPFHERG